MRIQPMIINRLLIALALVPWLAQPAAADTPKADVAIGYSILSTAFVIQPGGGVDIAVRPHVAIRLQGDYRAVRDEGEAFGELRFAAGVVFGFGMR